MKSIAFRESGSSIVEISLLMLALIGFILLPIGDIIATLAGFGFSQASTEYMAQEAAKGFTLAALQTNLVNAAKRCQSVGLAQLLKVSPAGGYLNCGADFYVVETNIYTGTKTNFGPNALPTKVDQSTNNYELCLKSKFALGPVFNLPYLGGVAGFGKPAEVNFATFKPIEHLSNLISSQTPTTISSGPTGLTGNSADWLGKATLASWGYPVWGDYALMPGQKIYEDNTVNVYATNPNWTDTGVTVYQNKRMSLVIENWFTKDGNMQQWQINGSMAMFWGNGGPLESNGFSAGTLIAKIGEKGETFYFQPSYNIIAPATGKVYFKCNDVSYADNALNYQLRVISTN